MRDITIPELLPWAPFVYCVWADGELTRAELEGLRGRMAALPVAAREQIKPWLDPGHPPTAAELARLLRDIRTAVSGDWEPRSLAELGARLDANGKGGPDLNQTLRDAERLLGMGGPEHLFPFLDTASPLAPLPVRNDATIATLKGFLDGPLADTVASIRSFLVAHPPLQTSQWTLGERREHVLREVQALSATGFPRKAYPGVTHDGDLGAFMAGFEALAHGDLSVWVKTGVQFGLFGGAILGLGTAEHKRRLEDVASGRLLGCFAMTERDHGSNVMALETTATYRADQDCFVVSTPHDGARKEYIGNAACHGQMAVVFAQLVVEDAPLGVHALLVPIRDETGQPMPGVRIEDCGPKMGLDGVDNGRLWFEDVEVPRSALLDRFGSVGPDGRYDSPIASPGKRFYQMLGTLVRGRVGVAGAGLSAAKVGLAIAIRYGLRRRQFGPTGADEQRILDYPAHQKRLIPLLCRSYAIHFALRETRTTLVDEVATGETSRQTEALAAGLKAYATRHATESLQAAREACGGAGYLADSRLPSLKADSDVFTTFEGDNTVLWQFVAKSLLSDFKLQFADSRFFGTVRFLADRAQAAIREKNMARTRRSDDSHLRNPDFHREALAYRERSLVASLARRIQHRLGQGKNAFDAFTEVQDYAIAAARAFVHAQVYRAMSAAIEDAEPSVQTLLAPVQLVFALDVIDSDVRWFLEEGYFEPVKAKAVRKLLAATIREVRDNALVLVDAFGIPSACLGVLGAD